MPVYNGCWGEGDCVEVKLGEAVAIWGVNTRMNTRGEDQGEYQG